MTTNIWTYAGRGFALRVDLAAGVAAIAPQDLELDTERCTERDSRVWSELRLLGDVNLVGLPDACELPGPAVVEPVAGPSGAADRVGEPRAEYRVVRECSSPAWESKRIVLDVGPDEVRLRVEVAGPRTGRGSRTDTGSTRTDTAPARSDSEPARIDSVRLAGGEAVLATGACGQFRSSVGYSATFSPNPSEPVAFVRPASAAVRLGVVGDASPGRLHAVFSPPPLCLGFGRVDPSMAWDEAGSADAWLGVHLAAPWNRLGFTWLDHEVLDGGWWWMLDYQGHTPAGDRWVSPELVFRPAATPLDIVRDHRDIATRAAVGQPDPALAAAVGRDDMRPAWWTEPIFCGWGAQCARAAAIARGDALGPTSLLGPAGPATDAGASELVGGAQAVTAPAMARRDLYDAWLARLSDAGLTPGTIVLDDKWALDYGTMEPDPAKWPDLKGWIADRHAAGQRVLLWFKAWDAAGLPDDECILTSGGHPVAADPTSPAYRARLGRMMRELLSPDGLDADGFKVDFTQRGPAGASLVTHADSTGEPVWGVALLHRLLAEVYRAAKAAKPDALVVTHTVNPLFEGVLDMVRLNDVLDRDPAGARVAPVDQLRFRHAVAHATLPGTPIDTDQWPMPTRAAWLDYARVQPRLGVPALYYVESIDGTGEAITASDLGEVSASWRAYRAHRDNQHDSRRDGQLDTWPDTPGAAT